MVHKLTTTTVLSHSELHNKYKLLAHTISMPLHHYWASLVAQTVKNPPTMQETLFNPWVRKIPWRREWLPTPVFLPGESDEMRSLAGDSPWGHKESDMTEQLALSLTTKV